MVRITKVNPNKDTAEDNKRGNLHFFSRNPAKGSSKNENNNAKIMGAIIVCPAIAI